MEKEIFKVNPIVIYPECILKNGYQGDCRKCANREKCLSPRSMCVRPYKGHKDGCPNYGKLPTCPPLIPCMYDQVFDMDEVYAIVTKYNLWAHYEEMRRNNPGLAEGQIQNKMYWQHTDKKNNDIASAEFFKEHPEMDPVFVSTRLLECMGVQVVDTMKQVGLDIHFPPGEYTYRVAFAAKVLEGALEKYGLSIKVDRSKEKRGLKTLVRKL